LIKPNLSELAQMTGAAPPDESAALASFAAPLCAKVDILAITCGADGAVLVTADQAWHGRIESDPNRVQHTVGCGDCMLAGLLDAAADDLSPPQVLCRGLAAATANTLQPTAAAFNGKDLPQLESRCVIEAIKAQ